MVRLAMMLRGSTSPVVVWKELLRKSVGVRGGLSSSSLLLSNHLHPQENARFSTATKAKEQQPPLVLTQLNHPTKGVATITMNNMPVNSLSLEMCTALSHAVKEAEMDSTIQSMILKSAKPNIFSAGLDILEMHQPNVERLHDFWHAFQQLYIDLYGSRLACIAAIQGNAPAAGCMLALSCDYRIMAATPSDNNGDESSKKPAAVATIGLNETKLGIAAPPWLARQFHDTIGRREAELGLSLGLLYTPEQALDIGLVDELVPTKEDVLTRAQQVAVEWGRIPPQARVASKMLMRTEAMDHLIATRAADTHHFVNFVTNPKVQENLTAYLEMLATKKRK